MKFEIKDILPYTLISIKMKFLDLNLTKYVFYMTKTAKTLMKVMKEELNKWRDT
jgi:hypothetical protein